MIFIAFAKVVTTKGRSSQNHGRREGITSIITIITAEIKKNNHHFAELSVVFIFKILANIEKTGYRLEVAGCPLLF